MCADSQTSPGQWTRREFVRGAAALVTVPHLTSGLTSSRQLAYLGSGDDSLRVFLIEGGRWTQVQRVASLAPACVLLSPNHNMLYVANALSVHERLPRGTIETFHIDADGRLRLAGRTALSLSATEPRHMAISADGKLLAVAAYGGGVYNLLPVADDGTLGSVQSIFKDTGCGAHAQLQTSAHPHTLIFDRTGGRLLSSDFGADRLSVFTVEDGRLQRTTQRVTGEGSGPSTCLLHPTAGVLYAWHALQSTLASYRYDGASLGEGLQRFSLPAHAQGSLALHPSGRTLYTAQGTLLAWRVDGDGKLSLKQEVSAGETKQVVAAPDGESVYTLGGASGSICAVRTDRDTGELHSHTRVAEVNQPGSLVFKTIS
jgi:6-phosphogluconolactonase